MHGHIICTYTYTYHTQHITHTHISTHSHTHSYTGAYTYSLTYNYTFTHKLTYPPIHQVDNIASNLVRAEMLVRNFTRRMASDRIIQAFFAINIVVMLSLVLYVAISG
ncbi:hypothetical protein EON63_11520 [archaeon]|nr:MAG: hypothetical protein EON63_11520 [archaeon]